MCFQALNVIYLLFRVEWTHQTSEFSSSQAILVEDNKLHSAVDATQYRLEGTNLVLIKAEERDTGEILCFYDKAAENCTLLLHLFNDKHALCTQILYFLLLKRGGGGGGANFYHLFFPILVII